MNNRENKTHRIWYGLRCLRKHDRAASIWSPSLHPRAVMLSPVNHRNGDTELILTLALLDDFDLRRAPPMTGTASGRWMALRIYPRRCRTPLRLTPLRCRWIPFWNCVLMLCLPVLVIFQRPRTRSWFPSRFRPNPAMALSA